METFRIELIWVDTVINEDTAGGRLAIDSSAGQCLQLSWPVGVDKKASQIVHVPHAGSKNERRFCTVIEQGLHSIPFAVTKRVFSTIGIGSTPYECGDKIPLIPGLARHAAGDNKGKGVIEIALQRVG